MSGGFAYVLDEDGTFAAHVNTGMVGIVDLEASDREALRSLVERHLELTGSGVAERLLADWAASVECFVKILPTDYAKVLEAQHLDPEEARLAAV
jgi:glutamate synthase domain-containing protein 3